MEVSGVTNIDSKIQTIGGKTLGKEDFMNLLIKQLSYQDPLNPMDSTQFTSQLTQFSSLEELNNINGTLEDVLAFQHSMQNAAVANMIGRTVKVEGNAAQLTDTANINYELSKDAASVKITIYDGSGKVAASKELTSQSQGENVFVWDGKDALGNQMPQGTYTYEIEAKDASGGAVSVLTNSSGVVTGVSFKEGMAYLELNNGKKINLSEILSIQ
ncbi:MAG: flagellar biosynthesis protein FlgD [Nitrospirae bacterium]|nr:flagellar biosynthesis protein FlgD [Nitrospirota bacterium]